MLRLSYQLCAQRVGFDIPAQRQEIVVGFDTEVLVATLIKMSACPTVMPVMPPHVRDRQPLHKALELIGAARAQDQVPVIGHHAPAKQIDGESIKSLGQHVEERLEIFGGAE
jgi:hypothetical protein